MNFSIDRQEVRPAENGPILRSFSAAGLTVSNVVDCYTFERFASSSDEIRTTYYYHYKRTTPYLKEETRWS